MTPTYRKDQALLGEDANLFFKGENWGDGYKDTEVKIGDNLLCWITWDDKEAFIKELNQVINKYRI
jgi:hypothetical protein